jgi:hypothetical protein
MAGWGCPHEVDGKCQKVLDRPCDIGMKGCVLAGRFRFYDDSKNRERKAVQDDRDAPAPSAGSEA